MIGFSGLIAACLSYVVLLFAIAFFADRRAAQGRLGWLQSPLIYTLSLSIYCTAWTFYGAVGYAARSGLEFVTIYLGPTLVMIGWWWLLRKLVQVARAQRITSIADLISSRYGKSNPLAALVTLLAVIGTTPYIALQLQSVTLSFAVFSQGTPIDPSGTALWVAAGLAVFTVLFGTRNLDANERHYGVVIAIAFEAVVKLIALLAVGVFVVWGVAGGMGDILARIEASPVAEQTLRPGRWFGLIFLSAAAFICLPRMFQVMVVENTDRRNLSVASWAFPLYLMLISLFVLPIAVVGLEALPAGSNPDLFVLTLPLAMGQDQLALLSFLGGFSSATSMVIVAAIALSTMVSNHIVMPIWLASRRAGATMSGDVRNVILLSRRVSIAAVLLLGYAYFRFYGGGASLAAIGLISFVGVAQVLPALLGGLFWQRATRPGALAGLLTGFAVWAYALFLPSFGSAAVLSPGVLADGPWGIGWLRPHALFGLTGPDPVVHAVFWSMFLNTLAFVSVSLLSVPSPLERLQGMQFVNADAFAASPGGWAGGAAGAEELLAMSQRIIGADQAQTLFRDQASKQGKAGFLPDPTSDFLETLERKLAGSVGAATAHAMIAQVMGRARVTVGDLMAMAGETAQIMEYSSQLEAKSDELSRTARQLREANEKLTELSAQKDAFLSQISHELRTPMTSVRAFSEILRDMGDLAPDDQKRYASIIHDEAVRLTRLLDDLLDLGALESGSVRMKTTSVSLREAMDRAITASGVLQDTSFSVERNPAHEAHLVSADSDRLVQVFINLISNARKYCTGAAPRLTIAVAVRAGRVDVDFVDNGRGVPARSQTLIFEKFSRLTDGRKAGGAGLGLAICREIMANMGGAISYLPGQGGAAFRVSLMRAGQ